MNGSEFSYNICAETVCGVAFAPYAMGVKVKPVSSKSTKITPDCGFVAHSAPHSPIFAPIFAPCQAPPAWLVFFKGRAVMMAVSVVRPEIRRRLVLPKAECARRDKDAGAHA